jgi:DNA-binding CsgD family transcriptional regulator
MGTAVSETDARAMLQFVSDLNSLEHPDQFRAGVLPGIRRLVSCEIASYNEIDFEAGTMVAAAEPRDWLQEGDIDNFIRLGQQNPLVVRYERTRDGRPLKWSDLITRRELHRTELYAELYSRIDIEYQMAFCLPAPPGVVIGLALSRSRRDFTERHRVLLNLIRGPMITALRNVQRYAALEERLAILERGVDQWATGVVLLDDSPKPRVRFANEAAQEALRITEGSPLPEPLSGWVERRAPGLVPIPMILDREESPRLAVHLLPARTPGGADSLLIETVQELLSIPVLRAAGLTRREAEALRLVALGRSNSEIAGELSISVRTVEKHLQNLYDKLGAASRTDAVQAAWSIARPRTAPGVA